MQDQGTETNDAAPKKAAQTGAPAKHSRRRKRRLWGFGIWSLLFVLVAGGILWLMSLSLTGRVVVLPDWVTEKVETEINTSMVAGHIGLNRVEFGVSPKGLPQLSLVDISVRDETGLEIAQIHRVQGAAQPMALLQGQVFPSRLYLTGAQVTLRRQVNGDFDLSFGQAGGASGDLASVLDAIDGIFAEGPMSMAETIEADELTITLEDARSGRLWQVTDGRLKLSQSDKIIDTTVSFDVFNQTDELAEVTLGFRTDKATSEASFGATFRNAAASDIAAQTPLLAFLEVIDAPISGALRTSIDANGEISELAGTLEIGAGALSPSPGVKPVFFDLAKVYISFNPASQRIEFTNITVMTEMGEVSGDGHIYLRDFTNGWPATLLGQVQLTKARINPNAVFADPIIIDGGAADFRLRLDPFTLELGQLVIEQGGALFRVSGEIAAESTGWSLALDAQLDDTTPQLQMPQILALWPLTLAPISRKWVTENVISGDVSDLTAGVRIVPGEERRVSVGASFANGSARVVKEMVPVHDARGYMSIRDKRFMIVTEGGIVTAPDGGEIDVTGTVFTVPDMPPKPTPAVVDLKVNGPLQSILTLLAQKPYDIFKNSDLGPNLATGQVQASGRLDLIMRPKMRPEDVDFDLTGTVTNVRSDVLVPGRTIRADSLSVAVTSDQIKVSGRARMGQATGVGTWSAAVGPADRGRSSLDANVTINQAFLDEFDIELPANSLAGEGIAHMVVNFARNQDPTYELTSDLNRLRLAISGLGWSKARNQTGRLFVKGRLGENPTADTLEFEAPGLRAIGKITIADDGGLARAEFSRVRLGGWLDAPVTFIGRGRDQSPAIRITGGSVDLGLAHFSGSSDPGNVDAPISVVLDRLQINESIYLTAFSGDLNQKGGLHGTFDARVNGGPRIRGVVAALENGSAIRITSSDAGGVLKAAGVFQTARGGDLKLILAPRAEEGVYDGDLTIEKIRVVGASPLAELLSAISVVGLLEQLSEEGIAFTEVESRFRMTPDTVIIKSGSAVGASLGVSIDGTYSLKNSEMDLSGVVSPIYILNSLGRIFTRKGEGLIGFTYSLKGASDDPKISVNPLSLLTPAMFREIFRRPPPELPD